MFSSRVFLLSPALCSGRRAQLLLRREAAFPLALDVAAGCARLGDVFAFLSGLYFRGKLTYARAFGAADVGLAVITPTRGLQPPDMPVSFDVLTEFAAVDVSSADPAYRVPLERDARALATRLGPGAEVILLGSIATDKYIDVLSGVFGAQLRFPAAFVGRGDMSRGALLLRAATERRELSYVPVLGSERRGRRAPSAVRPGG